MEDGDSMSKPSLEEYIYKLAPDTSVLDLVECYLTQHNTDTYYIGDKLVGFKSKKYSVNGGIPFTFERALIRITITGDENIMDGKGPNLNIKNIFKPALVLNSRVYTDGDKKFYETDYAVIRNNDSTGNISISTSITIEDVLVVMF